MLTISNDVSWTLHVAQKKVNISQTRLSEGISSSLQSVEAIIRVISLLDNTKGIGLNVLFPATRGS